jgi:hypothetical protein
VAKTSEKQEIEKQASCPKEWTWKKNKEPDKKFSSLNALQKKGYASIELSQ